MDSQLQLQWNEKRRAEQLDKKTRATRLVKKIVAVWRRFDAAQRTRADEMIRAWDRQERQKKENRLKIWPVFLKGPSQGGKPDLGLCYAGLVAYADFFLNTGKLSPIRFYYSGNDYAELEAAILSGENIGHLWVPSSNDCDDFALAVVRAEEADIEYMLAQVSADLSSIRRPGKERANSTDDGNESPAAETISDDSTLSVDKLAEVFKVPKEALRKRLDRCREKDLTCFIEVADRNPRDPRFLYKVGKVRSIVESMQASSETSGERPAKK